MAECPTRTYAFKDGREGNSKLVEGTFMLGLDVDIRQVLENGEMDVLELGLELKIKKRQILSTHDKHMVLGTPTSIPVAVLKRQRVLAIHAREARTLSEVTGRYNKSNHAGKKDIEFEVVTGYPTGPRYRKYEEGYKDPTTAGKPPYFKAKKKMNQD